MGFNNGYILLWKSRQNVVNTKVFVGDTSLYHILYYMFLSVVIVTNKGKRDMLACYIYPMPKGTEYTETDLRNPNNVVELFGYCGILEGLITKAGWRFLVEAYGYERLYEMDKEALWNDSENIDEYIDWVMNEIEISPEC